MIGFLKAAIADAAKPKLTMIQALQQLVGGYEPARGFKKIHASAITDPAFCPRQVALLDITGKAPKDKFIATALRTTFDMGNAVSELLREKWLGQTVIGHWKCRACKQSRSWCRKPKADCKLGGACDWRYVEAEFVSLQSNVSGSLDLMVDLGASKYFVVEVKIMAPDQFEKLAAPLAEHHLRTSLYLRLVDESASPYKSQINVTEGRVFYVSRGYGKKNLAASGEIIPFKEFVVPRDDALTDACVEKALHVRVWREQKKMPAGICDTSFCPKAKACSVSKECFSGQYPVTS